MAIAQYIGHPANISIGSLPLITISAIILLLGIYFVYQVYFHPLSKYPGPFLAKLTNAYQLYYGYRGDRHLLFQYMHEKYGSIVRYGPNHISFNTSSALKKIYNHSSAIMKSDFYDSFVHPAPNIHNTRDKAVHSRKRKVISGAFATSTIKEMEPYIIKNVQLFCDMMDPQKDAEATRSQSLDGVHWKHTIKPNEEKSVGWSAPRNMANWFSYLAMDILGDLCYGKDFELLEKPDNRYTLELLANATKRHLLCGIMPFIHKTHLDRIIFHDITAKRTAFVNYSQKRLTERTAMGNNGDRKDFFHYLLNAVEDGHSFTKTELWGESTLLLIAGSDTTSTSMAATLFYLVRSPAALKKATEEVRNTFATKDEIHTGAALSGCMYLRACIDEGMRLSPAVGGILPRLLLADVEIDGVVIPKGSTVGVPHYVLHHNKAYNQAPFAFVPERWIAGAVWSSGKMTTPEEVQDTMGAFAPFSIGARGCIGKGVAYAEMTNTLARLLWEYDLRKAEGILSEPGEGNDLNGMGRHFESEYQLVDTFTSVTPNSPLVQFRRRQDFLV